jgi:hypothetical protein
MRDFEHYSKCLCVLSHEFMNMDLQIHAFECLFGTDGLMDPALYKTLR